MKGTPRGVIEILCDGGGKHGFGHIRRSDTLARALTLRGYSVRFRAVSENGNRLMPEFVSAGMSPSVQILDIPYEIEPWIVKAEVLSLPTIALDYFGEARPTLTISIYEHRTPPPGGNRVYGLEYAIVRPEIVHRTSHECHPGVVVMIGGSDINRVGESIASLLVDTGQIARLIQGPGIKRDYIIRTPGIEVLSEPKDLETLMAECAWAVTNGGSSMMEMMCLGKAVHVIPQTAAEQHLAELIMDQGALLGIGLDEFRVPSTDNIADVGRRAKLLVDGHGIDRIISLIEKTADEHQ